MKKYIHLAKAVKPTLTTEACERLSEEYSKLRAFDTQNSDIARVCIYICSNIFLYNFVFKKFIKTFFIT